MSMNFDRARQNLLAEAAVDYIGLYEVAIDLPAPEHVSAARSVVQEVLDLNEGRLYRTTTWPPTTFEPVAREEWAAVMAADTSFEVPADTEPAVLYWVAIGD